MIKTEFGIKDLENLSNIKAHTIRIWEKRYNLLEPERTDTNIRKYSLDNLKKLLNISYLYQSGHKISTLASLQPAQLEELIKSNLTDLNADYMLQIFKSMMFDFNSELFDATFEKLEKTKTFREIFTEIFLPLLNEVGVLWHSGTVDPSHEHFISEMIKHKIIWKIEEARRVNNKAGYPTFVLYLPYAEIHEIGLLYANYELLSAGHNTIYLGPNVPLDSLSHVLQQKKNVIFLTSFTVHPEQHDLKKYMRDFQEKVNSTANCELWIMGRKSALISKNPPNVRIFKNIKSFFEQIENLAIA